MAQMSFAVGGGKGGTGKSLVAANLAVTMAQSGLNVVLVDADLGAANVHTMFGVDRPGVLLEHFITRQVETLEETLISTELKTLKLICGGMPLPGTANPKYQQKMRLIRHLKSLDADVIISDIGAGVSFNTLDIFNAAQIKVAVFTSQLTSVHNGYGFLKAALHRHLLRSIDASARIHLESAGPEAGEESLGDMLVKFEEHEPEAAQKAQQLVSGYRACLVGNMLTSIREGYVINAVSQMVRDHLHIQAPVIGLLRQGDKLKRSVNERRPFMLKAGIESNAELFRKMANTLIGMAKDADRTETGELIARAVDGSRRAYERQHPRFPINFNGVLKRNGAIFPCRVRNLSEGGALLVFAQKMNGFVVGTLRIISPDKSDVSVQVKETHRDKTGQRLGLAFVNLARPELMAITRLVADATALTAVQRESAVPTQNNY